MIVAGAHGRHDEAQVHRDLAAQRLHPGEQVVARPGDDVDEVGREQDLQRVHAHLLDDVLGRLRPWRALQPFGGVGIPAGLGLGRP